MSRRAHFVLFFKLSLTFGAILVLGTESAAAQDVSTVAVAARSSELGDLLKRSAELELQRLGYSLAQEAEGASHLINLGYRSEGRRIDLDAALSTRADGAVLADRSAEGTIDLTLDDTVESLVRELMDDAGVESLRVSGAPASVENADGLVQGTNQGGAPGTELAAVIPADRDPFFQISSGFTPFVPIGPVARYADVGYGPSLSIRRTWIPGRVEVSTGVVMGGHNVTMTGAVTQGSSWFIPVGAAFWLSSPTVGQVLAAHLVLSAGGVATLLSPAAGETQQSILPFVQGGLGVTFPLTSQFGISLETGYIAIFDGSFPISGFLPTLQVSYRL